MKTMIHFINLKDKSSFFNSKMMVLEIETNNNLLHIKMIIVLIFFIEKCNSRKYSSKVNFIFQKSILLKR